MTNSRFPSQAGLAARTARTGAALSATVLAAVASASAIETGKPLAAVNAISHCVHGDVREYGDRATIAETGTGIAINSTAMFSWAFLWELLFGRKSVKEAVVPALLGTGIAYLIDYHVVPKRLSPGIEKRLSWKAIAAVYGVLAATLALSPLWNAKRVLPAGHTDGRMTGRTTVK